MAIMFFVGDHIAIDVGDPGYGYVVATFWSDDEARWGKNHECTLRGNQMWRALEDLTDLACRDLDEPLFQLQAGRLIERPVGDVAGLWPMTVREARKMVPQFQAAVLYAAAGSDRAERLTDDDEANHVLCSRCNEGSVYSGHVMTSEWCEQYGHQPFGYAGNWVDAQAYAERERQWAETRQRMADPIIVPTDTVG